MWDLPRPGLEPVFPALAGGFLTTVPPGKSPRFWSSWVCQICNEEGNSKHKIKHEGTRRKEQSLGALFPSCKVQLLGTSPLPSSSPHPQYPRPPHPAGDCPEWGCWTFSGTSLPFRDCASTVSWILGPKQASHLIAPFLDSGGPGFTPDSHRIGQWLWWSKFGLFRIFPSWTHVILMVWKSTFNESFPWMFCSNKRRLQS